MSVLQNDLTNEIKALFAAVEEEVFEDGIETSFSRQLVDLVNHHPNVVGILGELIFDTTSKAELVGETLRWLGRIEDQATHQQRLQLLERGLTHSAASIRDAALLGLASMGDSQSIPALEQAIAVESISHLRKNMLQVVEQLNETASES